MHRFARGAVLVLVSAAGCTSQQLQNAGDRTLHSIASQAPRFASNAAIAAQIEARFVSIDPNSALHVAVALNDGAVRLSGRVASSATAAKYVAAAKAIRGVRTVDAPLAIDPALGTPQRSVRDFALVAAVRANLAAQGGVNGLALRVTAHDGTVTLDGAAKNAGVKAALLDAVRNTAGVRSVLDNIRIGS